MTREEAIKQLESLLAHCLSMKNDGDPIWDNDCEALKMAILALDTESLRPRGTWKDFPSIRKVNKTNVPVVQCSVCKIFFCDLINNHRFMYKYCPYCGAKMEVGY